MRHQSRIIRLLLVACCSLSALCAIADDPFAGGDPFSKRRIADPKPGVTRMTIEKPTPRSKTLAESSYQLLEGKLSSNTAIRVKEMPLSQLMREISEAHQIPIFPQQRVLRQAKVSLDSPVTIDVRSVSLRMGLRLVLSKAGLDFIVKDEVVQYTTRDAALRTPVEMHYQMKDQDEKSIKKLVESLQEMLDKEYRAPMPQPVVKTTKGTELNNGGRTLSVTCNYRMHGVVRNHLCKIASVESESLPR